MFVAYQKPELAKEPSQRVCGLVRAVTSFSIVCNRNNLTIPIMLWSLSFLRDSLSRRKYFQAQQRSNYQKVELNPTGAHVVWVCYILISLRRPFSWTQSSLSLVWYCTWTADDLAERHTTKLKGHMIVRNVFVITNELWQSAMQISLMQSVQPQQSLAKEKRYLGKCVLTKFGLQKKFNNKLSYDG